MQSLLTKTTATQIAATQLTAKQPTIGLFAKQTLSNSLNKGFNLTRRQPAYIKVSYQQFRELLEDQGPTTVKRDAQETRLLSNKRLRFGFHKAAAIIKPARIDAQGHCFPTSYYVSSALIESQALAA